MAFSEIAMTQRFFWGPVDDQIIRSAANIEWSIGDMRAAAHCVQSISSLRELTAVTPLFLKKIALDVQLR
jgi:hypothetical protein